MWWGGMWYGLTDAGRELLESGFLETAGEAIVAGAGFIMAASLGLIIGILF